MPNVDAQLAGLEARVDSGFRHVDRQLDDQGRTLNLIRDQVYKTNSTVGRHDEQLKAIWKWKDRLGHVTPTALSALSGRELAAALVTIGLAAWQVVELVVALVGQVQR